MKHILRIACVCLGLVSLSSMAVTQHGVSKLEKEHVDSALAKFSKVVGKKFIASDIEPSPIHGLLQVTADMHIFYVSMDGKYIISGEMLDLSKDPNSWGLTEQAMRAVRKKIIAGLSSKDMIVFPAKAPKIGVAMVFTDVDCHYCKELQKHITEYTDIGIELRYLAFPRSGPKSPSFDKAVSIWCAKDKQRQYILATEGKEVIRNHCHNNSVAKDFELGKKLGINGTPTILLENGMKIGGVIPAAELAKIIQEDK